MPLPFRLVVGSLLVLAAVALLAAAALGARSSLRRNRWFGVRTPATLRSDASFIQANRVAAPLVGAAGLVCAVGGAGVAGGHGPVGWVVLAVALVGTLVLAGLGGVLGDRAAGRVPAAAGSATCVGACTGCDLVAGCRPPGGPRYQPWEPGPPLNGPAMSEVTQPP